jgi:hypothetical protein
MGFGDLINKAKDALGGKASEAAESFGGTDELISKISDSGINLSALTEMDADSVTSLLEEHGIDLSMLENFGLSVEDLIEKVKEYLGR